MTVSVEEQKEPIGQASQSEAPAAEYVPSGQFVGVAVPAEGHLLPRGHCVQSVEPAEL